MLSTRDGLFYIGIHMNDLTDDGLEAVQGSHNVLIERRVCLRVKSRVLFKRIVRILPGTVHQRHLVEYNILV